MRRAKTWVSRENSRLSKKRNIQDDITKVIEKQSTKVLSVILILKDLAATNDMKYFKEKISMDENGKRVQMGEHEISKGR